ncbi:MAG: TetR/AcrR family transcriptional regulator [Polyangiales bacterium]
MKLPRMGPRPVRGDPSETRTRLVIAAAKLFHELGFFATDSNAIARAAGYSPGTFYKHFEGKTEIFVAAYEWWVANVWSGVDEAWARNDLRHALEHVVSVHRAWAGLRRDLRHLASSEKSVRRAYLAEREIQVEKLVAAGASRAGAVTLLYAVERTADAIADGEPERLGVTDDALVSELVDLARRVVRRSHHA